MEEKRGMTRDWAVGGRDGGRRVLDSGKGWSSALLRRKTRVGGI